MSRFPTKRGDLWVRTFGDPPASVVALHGFTLHGGMFQTLADELGTTVAAPDLPGHGRTTIEPITMESAVAAVAELLADLPTLPILVGYSQGGRVALQIALAYPELVESLILISTGPGLPSTVRKVRRVADDALATRIERIGLERFIEEWLANPVIATDGVSPDVRRADRELRFENTAAGLAEALRGMGQASVPDSIRRFSSLPMPLVMVAGQRDTRYSELAHEMAATRDEYPVIVRGAGHNVVLEAPQAVAIAIGNLLSA